MSNVQDLNQSARDVVTLTAENISRIVKGLPFKAKLALRGLMRMQHGSLGVTLPDGRKVFIKGKTAGPDAALTLRNWNLAGRALTSGTIGVAETYMDGDWDSPDITALLELTAILMARTVSGASSSAFATG